MTDLLINTVEHKLPFARRTLNVHILINGATYSALIDSGAMGLYIDSSLIKKLNIPTTPLSAPIKVLNVDGTENIAGKIRDEIIVDYEVCGRRMSSRFLITSLGKQGIILARECSDSVTYIATHASVLNITALRREYFVKRLLTATANATGFRAAKL